MSRERVKVYQFITGNFGGVTCVADEEMEVSVTSGRYPVYDQAAVLPLVERQFRWVTFEGADYPITPQNELFIAAAPRRKTRRTGNKWFKRAAGAKPQVAGLGPMLDGRTLRYDQDLRTLVTWRLGYLVHEKGWDEEKAFGFCRVTPHVGGTLLQPKSDWQKQPQPVGKGTEDHEAWISRVQ